MKLIPVTAIIPTANRSEALRRTLESISQQDYQPVEIIVVDASEDELTAGVCNKPIGQLLSAIRYARAINKGAAIQRNQAFQLSDKEVIFFLDDDIIMEPACIERLWNCLQSDEHIGGVNAMISNQRYHTPGKLTRLMYRVMSGKNLLSYAGKCIGPAWNLLPEDRAELPECNEVEWLNTTCTLYKRKAMPVPVFANHFKGYSLLEDLALSLTVAKKWKLYNARTARIFHDSQGGQHKSSISLLAEMEFVNRHYVMTRIMDKSGFLNYCRLFLFELFGMTVVLTNIKGWKNFPKVAWGKLRGFNTILFTKNNYAK